MKVYVVFDMFMQGLLMPIVEVVPYQYEDYKLNVRFNDVRKRVMIS